MAAIGNTLSLRLVGFLLAGVVLFSLAMAFAFIAPLSGSRTLGERLPMSRQMAAIADVLDASTPAERPRLLTALNSVTLSVELVDALPAASAGQAGATSAPLLTRFLDRYDKAFASRDIHVELQRQGLFGGEVNGWRAVRLYVRLSDGKWVLMQPVRGALLNGVLWRGLLIVGVTGLAVIVLLVIAARQTARPIERLASSARTLADRLDAPDLELKGPKELRQLTQAFNDMKIRIRSLLNERTRLAGAIAHDLRTYMTRLRMRAEFISDPVQRRRAEADIEEMNGLIEDTLLFARSAEKGEALNSRIDVASEVEAFVFTRAELGQSVSLINPPSGPVWGMAEPVALRRILSNLTDNAIRYGQSAALTLTQESEFVVVAVADRGPGIPENEMERIISPFERLEPSRGRDFGGAGLGLAIVKALTERHGGRMTLAKREGGGLIVRIHLHAG